MGQLSIDFDASFGTDPKKLSRRDSPDTSVFAAHSVDTTKLEKMVYESIKKFGESGCISDQLLSIYSQFPYSSITARYRALIDKGLVEDTGERRTGRSGRKQRVMRAV